MQRVSTLLGEFVATRDLELRQAFGSVTKGNSKVQETVAKLGQKHERLMNDTATRGVELSTSFQRRTVECKRTRDGALKSVGSAQASFKDGLSAMQASLATTTTSYSGELQRHGQSLQTSLNSGLDRHNRAKRARVESMNTMVTDVQSELRHLQRGIASTSRNVDGFVTRVVSEGVNLSNTAELYHKAVSGELNTLQDMTRSLVDQGTREDVPTGMTPRKRVWEYVDKWELTKNRDALLQSWRQGHSTANSNATSVPETFSLPNVVEETAEQTAPVENEPLPGEPAAKAATTPSAVTLSLPAATSPVVPPPMPPPPVKAVVAKSGLPALAALADRPTNILGPRGSRRMR